MPVLANVTISKSLLLNGILADEDDKCETLTSWTVPDSLLEPLIANNMNAELSDFFEILTCPLIEAVESSIVLR